MKAHKESNKMPFHKIQKLEVGESYVTGEAQIAHAAYVAGAMQVVGAANVTTGK